MVAVPLFGSDKHTITTPPKLTNTATSFEMLNLSLFDEGKQAAKHKVKIPDVAERMFVTDGDVLASAPW